MTDLQHFKSMAATIAAGLSSRPHRVADSVAEATAASPAGLAKIAIAIASEIDSQADAMPPRARTTDRADGARRVDAALERFLEKAQGL